MGRKNRTSNGARARRNARERGYRFESSTARLFNGYVYKGQAGDVIVETPLMTFRVECKYRSGLAAYSELRDHIEQAKRNVEGSDHWWCLTITGGKTFQNAESYTLLPSKRFKELLDMAVEGTGNAELRDLLKETVREVMDER